MKLDEKASIKDLYKVKNIYDGLKETVKDRKVLKWLGGGMFVYGLPAVYRYVTKNPLLPYLPLINTSSDYIPSNLPEKLIVNFVAPGGAGAVVGETFVEKFTGKNLSGVKKYLSRVGGSLATTGIWTGIQYLGYTLSNIFNYQWPSGGNPFEPPTFYPFNMLLALTLAPLAPYVVEYAKRLYTKVKSKP